jgi:hypothetical protein
MSEYHHAFDKYMGDFLVGEMVWNFADFMTVEGVYVQTDRQTDRQTGRQTDR